MKSPSIELRLAVKRLLIPHILAMGFQPDERPIWKDDPYGHQQRRFLRPHEEILELLEIQFDKHGRGAFVINLGSVPRSGVECYGKHYSQETTALMHLQEKARLYASKAWRMRWFGFPLIKVPLIRNPSGERIVEMALELFPQINDWFGSGIVGPNVRVTNGH